VADPEPSRREGLAARYGARAYEDHRGLLADPRVEVVIVATPPHLHPEPVLAALRSGRPVLCEKPLAIAPDECRRMVEEAERRNLALATGFNIRHFPAFARARAEVEAGTIGELDFVRAAHGHPGGKEFTHPEVHDAAVSGGGTLMDNGIHLLDLVRFFAGEIAEVKGYRRQSVWQFPGCEDNALALLRTRDGRIVSVHSSWTEWRGYGFFVEAYGTRGFVRASYPPMLLRIAKASGPGQTVRSRWHVFPALQIRERLFSWRWTLRRSFERELEDFRDAVASGRPPSCSGRDGLAAVEIAHAIYRSADTGETVELGR
jgi:predicted dehydrogenase